MSKNNVDVRRVKVLDVDGKEISTTWANRALKLIMRNKAELVSEDPLTIRLLCAVEESEKNE